MAMQPAFGTLALASAARGSGTYTSGPISLGSFAKNVMFNVHATAASGTSPTLNVSLEQSADGTSWGAVPNSGATQLTAAGNAVAGANPTALLVRVTATVAGTSPSFTFSVFALVAGD